MEAKYVYLLEGMQKRLSIPTSLLYIEGLVETRCRPILQPDWALVAIQSIEQNEDRQHRGNGTSDLVYIAP